MALEIRPDHVGGASNSTKHGVKGRVYLTPEQVLLAARQLGVGSRQTYGFLV